jgi:hypothetical protein
MAGLELTELILLQLAHAGSVLVKINCKKGISIPIDTIEKIMLNKV